MNFGSLNRLFGLSAVISLALGCGGNVSIGTGSGGEGGSGATGNTTTGNSTTSGTGGAGNSTTVAGGTGGFGGFGGCDGMNHTACVANFPQCLPVYDDECCPSCNPQGGCADCINIQFHHCEAAPNCKPASCGFIPEWACNGKQPDCDIDPGGSTEPCATAAGCIPAYCNLNLDCTTDPICHPIGGNICTAFCESLPPPCPDGTTAETNGSCWTGMCIPAELCPPIP
ncbi:MAG: hypothetical protein IPK82_40730 [Polyangiaceae bacterium]|nr:hypothetical protein [Polyangiaceae bacterium]